jgi:hypothetical protein
MEDGPTQDTEAPRSQLEKKSGLRWIALALLGAGAAGWYLFGREAEAPVAVVDAGPPKVDAGLVKPLSLEEGDALLRKLAAGWSSSADLQKLLATPFIVRILAAAANLVADGDSPRPVLNFIDFKEPFAVEEREGPKPKRPPARHGKRKAPPERPEKLFMSEKAYSRFDGLTGIFGGIDAAAAGQGYRELRPYFDVAFAQIGRPGKKFDEVLSAALERMLAVKPLEGKIELVSKGALYLYKDPELEKKSAAEKLLLRMGPKNGRVVQDQLAKFKTAAGL